MTPIPIQWLIPVVRLREEWRDTQARDDRHRQLTKAEDQRRRRAERNLKIAKARLS